MSYSAEILLDNPRAYYRMDESTGLIQDSSGNLNHATSNEGAGSATYSQTGAILNEPTNYSIRFNPPYNFVIPDHATLDVGDIFTLECWVKVNIYPTTTFFDFITKEDGAYEFRLNGDGQIRLVKSATSDTVGGNKKILLDNKFHHVVGTKNGSTVKIYIDGEDVTGPIDLSTYINNALSLKIGASAFEAFNGWLDEIAIYAVALPLERIRAHYEAGLKHIEADTSSPKHIGRGAGW